MSSEQQELFNNKVSDNEVNVILENSKITENKIQDIYNNIEEVTLNTSDNILSKLENLDDKFKVFNNDLNDLLRKINEYIKSKDNFIDINIFKEMFSYVDHLSPIQNIAFMNLSALIFILLSITSVLSIYFSDYLIEKFNIKQKIS